MTIRRGDDLRPEYDLATLEGGVRGKYYTRATAGTNLVLLGQMWRARSLTAVR